jgi:hypothetical protein
MAHKILKMSIFITHDIVSETSPHGQLLLQLLRSFLILDTYTSMEVHTTETLQKGEEELLHYSEIMQV